MKNVLFKQVIIPNGRKKYVPCGIEETVMPAGMYFVDIRKNSK